MTQATTGARWLQTWRRGAIRALALVFVLFASALVLGGCTCAPESSPPPSGLIACRPQHPTRATVARGAPLVETAAAGSLSARFAVSNTGSGTLVMPFATIQGRGGLEPAISLVFDSAAGEGVLGVGFSIQPFQGALCLL